LQWIIRPALGIWFSARPCYLRPVKIIFLALLAVVCLPFVGCTSGKKPKSGYRNYHGDSSPNIRMFEEKPGYPVNTR